MRIEKLAIRNVASIESADIDFGNGPLGDAPLFLICGETGSGKTTILDCITLALYGRTPRYSGSRVKNAQNIGGYAFNDVRQLVRRGASSASATLSFTGNDGRRYEAEWSVSSFLRGAGKGSLKPEVWRWRDCSAGGLTWTRDADCRRVSLHAVGLGFEQFCRTTMLAQGQFTRFLLGGDDEKAEILEKLTDTSRYSELGKAIAARYLALDSGVREIEDGIAKLSGLGDRRGQVLLRIEELSTLVADVATRRRAADARLQWLRRRGELSANAAAARSGLARAFGELKELERRTREKAASARNRHEVVRARLDGCADMAAMYESSDVILHGLGDVRNARAAMAREERAMAKSLADLPGLDRRVDAARTALDAAKKAFCDAEARADAEERALEAMDRTGVQRDRRAAENLRDDLADLEARISGIVKLGRNVAVRESEVAAHTDELARREAELPGLKSAAETAAESAEAARAARDGQKKLVEDGIEKLVADLHVGDTCPVCGGRIERLHAGGHFEALFRELDAGCDEAEALKREKEALFNRALAAADALKKSIESERNLVTAERSEIAREQSEVAAVAAKCGLADGRPETLDAAKRECKARIDAFDTKLAEIDGQEKKAKELQKALKSLRRTLDEAMSGVVAAEKDAADCRSRVRMHKSAAGSADGLARKRLADVADSVSVPGWLDSWERNAAAAESEFRAAAAAYAADRKELQELEAELSALRNALGQTGECIGRAISAARWLESVPCGESAAESTSEVDGLLGRFEESRTAEERHAAARPDGLLDSDSDESLSAQCEALRAEESRLIEERGRCQQQIADDDMCADERRAMREKAGRLVAERDEWRPIYMYFGDADGKKIRREIQSYVLANVLVKANYYLRQLTDRYELSCAGLALSVLDAFDGGAARPVNTLSGGEQFLVSLALALGLAGMDDAGLGVDMLLVDEGFGTLSGEHLDSAIEALERLNALTGSRKVGVISHVERLRERIRVHIEVSRRGHEPSKVSVVSK